MLPEISGPLQTLFKLEHQFTELSLTVSKLREEQTELRKILYGNNGDGGLIYELEHLRIKIDGLSSQLDYLNTTLRTFSVVVAITASVVGILVAFKDVLASIIR